MTLWPQFFGPEAIIFGIRHRPKCDLNGRSGQGRIGRGGS